MYNHYCHDWDGLYIGHKDIEFICCTCFEQTPAIQEIKDKLVERIEKTIYKEVENIDGK